MTKKIALVTGVTGQDGSYLSELLLEKGYEVHGIIRRSSSFNTGRIDHIFNNIHLHYGDVEDGCRISGLINLIKPDEVYNLAAMSHVAVSFQEPVYTANVTAVGTLTVLEAIRAYQDATGNKIRFYQASSSEMFGKVQEVPQTEKTPFYPRSPYGVSKVFAHWATINYREAYGIHASSGILFNHEGPRRGPTFVTRKITRAATRISLGLQDKLYLGNLEAKRDWGHSKDYVNAMWLMLQQDVPDDYVIATGETHTVREFVDLAFKYVGLDYEKYVALDERYCRPSEVDLLIGDSSKAKRVLGWEPKIKFSELVSVMMESDMKLAIKEKAALSN